VSFDPAQVNLRRTSARRIGHEIAATELAHRRAQPDTHVWVPAPRIGAGRDSVPDLLLIDRPSRQILALTEIDVGYPRARLIDKLRGAVSDQPGEPYGYILGTSHRSRAAWFVEQSKAIADDLPRLGWVEAWWLDLTAPADRYRAYAQAGRVTQARWER
jgi:hypothetical protein